MKKLILSVLLVNLLAACSSNPPKETVAPKPVQAAQAPATETPAAATPDNAGSQAGMDAKTAAAAAAAAEAEAKRVEADTNASAEAKAKAEADAQAAARRAAELQANTNVATSAAEAEALKKHSVYFPFDVDAVQSDDLGTIQAHAQNLADNPDLKARVEGNADERGSSEYNLALGQRRANNTKKALVLGGAHAEQIETISYGEEKPLCTGHEESCWSQNRRADIEYLK